MNVRRLKWQWIWFFFSLSLSLYLFFFTIILICMILMTGTPKSLLTSLQDVVMLASASQSPQAAWETLGNERLRVATSGQWKTPSYFGVYRGWKTTQLCGDYSTVNHETRIPFKLPVQWKVRSFFFAWLIWAMKKHWLLGDYTAQVYGD